MSQETAMRSMVMHTFAHPTQKDAASAREFLDKFTSLLVSKKDLSVTAVGIRIPSKRVGIPEALIHSLLDAAKLVAKGIRLQCSLLTMRSVRKTPPTSSGSRVLTF